MKKEIRKINNPGREGSYRWKTLSAAAIILVILVILTYSGATRNNFVSWDDYDYIIDNELIRNDKGPDLKEIFSTVVSLNYHPVTILSLSLNNNKCPDCPDGISARPFITGNIILHTINTILVFILIYLLFNKNLTIAFIVAALFGVHTMHVESVAWISARKDVLSSFFFLSGLIFWFTWLKAKKYNFLWLLISFLLFILACLSKATAVVFPLIAIFITYLVAGEEDVVLGKKGLKVFFSRVIISLLPFFAISLITGLITIHIQNGGNLAGMLKFTREPEDVVNIAGPFSVVQRFGIASYGFFIYLIKFLLPVNQSAFYPYPSAEVMDHGSFSFLLWISMLALIITVILVILSMKKTRLFMFCFGFYLTTLILVLHFVSVGNAMIAERYTYLPYIGLAIIPAWYISRSRLKTKRILLFISGSFIIIMLLLARKQVRVWHDTESLWTQVIERYPTLEMARSARGKYYYKLASLATDAKERRNLEDKALADFRIAIRENTVRAEVYEYTGVIMLSRNDLNNALQFLNVSIKLNPEKGRSYFNRAIIYDRLNQKEKAISDYESALKFSPEMELEILRNRSVLYLETGQYKKALSDLDELIKLDGKNFTSYYNRAFAKVMLKDIKGAIEDYEIVLKLNPGDNQTMDHIRILKSVEFTNMD